nr:hypothetical protein [Marinicella sp. W31]MDC2876894.1 hypothetical protein [Marinicella sp. W31]
MALNRTVAAAPSYKAAMFPSASIPAGTPPSVESTMAVFPAFSALDTKEIENFIFIAPEFGESAGNGQQVAGTKIHTLLTQPTTSG